MLASDPASSTAAQSLPPELHDIVHALCDTYEELDLRIETTLGAAEHDFLKALPEIKEQDEGLRRLVGLLISDLRRSAQGVQSQPVLVQLAFQGEGDLTQQLLSNLNMPGSDR